LGGVEVNDKLIFYSNHAKELQGSTGSKIRAIIRQGAIEYDKANKRFICKPIDNPDGTPYNSTTYAMKNHSQFGFECDCQGWQTKFKKHNADPINAPSPICSHVAALYEYLKRKNASRRESRIESAMEMFQTRL
jgi:hypothetical protein